jgi:class 3 adenylate cyclase/tetratricopeptide (TPR) repeat protein
VSEIRNWLDGIGLPQYADAFKANDIDLDLLGQVDDQTLKDIGVSSAGHRLRIRNAIAKLSPVSTLAKNENAANAATEPKIQDVAERRRVTVMFSDLVGSTALSARMDPEDLREVISAYQKCVAETARRFGGFVAKYMGDGVLVYFGYPQAHEDDAERAVRAGLELVQAVDRLNSSASLQTRVGIATGLVIVGDLIGSGEAQERGIVGETPNLAARLQGIAKPNAVVIAKSTRRLLGNLFDLQDLGAQDLKGMEGPVKAWGVLRSSSIESRFEALHAGGMTELVGREEELELLLRRWSKSKTGEGQVVLLSGEAGIGKSRLTAALMERLADEPHTRLRYFCSPQHTDSALYPVIGQMERAAGLVHDHTAQSKLDKLDAMLAQTATSKMASALFAELLSLPNDGRYPALNMDPQQRRQKTLEALTAQMEALSRQKPVLMIFEDAHWTDPTSLETFGRVIDVVRSLPVLLIVTFRPEFEPPWSGRAYVTTMTINRLAERNISAMIDGVVGNKLLPANVRQDIIERTDGIPLFVEEMTKAVLEAGSEGAEHRTFAFTPSPALVPASLQASLMARLDRLGAAKGVAQVGATIGREFSHALLSAVVSKPEPELLAALEHLIATGLLFRQGVPPHANYLFKHALVQDAAYGTLLREPRRALHARIVEVLESKFAEIAEGQPELLAHHCTEAGLTGKAGTLWGKAGQRASERSAFIEAIKHFRRALSQISTMPSTPALRRQEMKLQAALITPLMQVNGYAASETKDAAERAHLLFKKAESLGEAPDDPLVSLEVLNAFAAINIAAFNGDAALALAAQLLALAEKRGTTVHLMRAHDAMGLSSYYVGDFSKARRHLDQAVALYEATEHRALFGQDSLVHALVFRSRTNWMLGYPRAALADAEHALSYARQIGQAATLMSALGEANFTFAMCGNHAAAQALLGDVASLSDERGASFWKATAILGQAYRLAGSGKTKEAVQMFTSGIAARRLTGATLFIPWYLLGLSRVYAKLGNYADSWRCIGEAITAVKETRERWCEAEVYRTAGAIALKSPMPDAAKAEGYFEQALSVARKQQAKSWELRAAMSMARLWRDQGMRDEARELLAPVYGWFTEGFDTRDLIEAKALLEELGA